MYTFAVDAAGVQKPLKCHNDMLWYGKNFGLESRQCTYESMVSTCYKLGGHGTDSRTTQCHNIMHHSLLP